MLHEHESGGRAGGWPRRTGYRVPMGDPEADRRITYSVKKDLVEFIDRCGTQCNAAKRIGVRPATLAARMGRDTAIWSVAELMALHDLGVLSPETLELIGWDPRATEGTDLHSRAETPERELRIGWDGTRGRVVLTDAVSGRVVGSIGTASAPQSRRAAMRAVGDLRRMTRPYA